jgi:hypothetical protein
VENEHGAQEKQQGADRDRGARASHPSEHRSLRERRCGSAHTPIRRARRGGESSSGVLRGADA